MDTLVCHRLSVLLAASRLELLLDGHPALNVSEVLASHAMELCDAIREFVKRESVKMVEEQIS